MNALSSVALSVTVCLVAVTARAQSVATTSSNKNSAPVITGVRADPAKSVGQCEPITITVTARDPDGDNLTTSWKVQSAPQGAQVKLQAAGNTATFSSNVVGAFALEVKVDDGKGHVTKQTIRLQVAAGAACTITFAEIIHAYHGALVDRNRKVINLNKVVIERLLDSMITSLTSVPLTPGGEVVEAKNNPRPQPKPPLDPALVQKVLKKAGHSDDLRIVSKSVLAQKGIDAAPPDEKFAYQWRLDLIHERSLNFLAAGTATRLFPTLESFFGPFDLVDLLRRVFDKIRRPTSPYAALCRANSVPVPPDWPTGGWNDQGPLPFAFNFLESGPDTRVWTYQAPGGQGLCYALPRMEGATINFLGIICQSKTTGKACFWDNMDQNGQRITGPNLTIRISEVQNGSSLGENCTSCHRGNNVFLIHPNTVLGNIPYQDRQPNVRYSPLGQANWVNPPPLSAQGSGACSGCHEIPELTKDLCPLLKIAAERTMPCEGFPQCRTVANPVAGWDEPIPAYAAHISSFKEVCGPLTTP
jgi:hypothetical protein